MTEFKDKLELFTKNDLIAIFKSLELKLSDKKTVLIDQIIAGRVTSSEISDFEVRYSAITTDNTVKVVDVVEVRYITLRNIRESGTEYSIGSDYTGKFAEKFLKRGLIKIK